jgi:hypothetical protein
MNHRQAHHYCTSNQRWFAESKQAGCFYCCQTFSPKEITNWINDRLGETAICPKCGIDSVIPSSKVTFDKKFLLQMKKMWF